MPTHPLAVPVAVGPRIPGIVLECGAAALVVAVGVLGVVPHSWLRQALGPWINIHALFGVLLCGMGGGRFYWGLKHSPLERRSDVRDLSRLVSRRLYLLLFLVIGVRQVIGLANGIGYGGTFGVELPAAAPHVHGGGIDPKDDLQALFLAGVLALYSVRILAYAVWRGSMSRIAKREANGSHSD
jgi:hypothetical protein